MRSQSIKFKVMTGNTPTETALTEIQKHIDDCEERLRIGEEILWKARQQMIVLKKKLKEFERLKQQVLSVAADGDL